MPAGRGFVAFCTRAASGITLPAQRPVREVLTGLVTGTARVTPVETRKVSAPRLGRSVRIERSGLIPEAWPDAEPWGPAVPLARAAVERRQASAPSQGARCAGGCSG